MGDPVIVRDAVIPLHLTGRAGERAWATYRPKGIFRPARLSEDHRALGDEARVVACLCNGHEVPLPIDGAVLWPTVTPGQAVRVQVEFAEDGEWFGTLSGKMVD